MSTKDHFETYMQSHGSWDQPTRPPREKGLSRRLIGAVGVDTATIRIGDPFVQGAAVLLTTGGDGIYPVWGTYLDGELVEITLSANYFHNPPRHAGRVSDDDDLADLNEARSALDALPDMRTRTARNDARTEQTFFESVKRLHDKTLKAVAEAEKELQNL